MHVPKSSSSFVALIMGVLALVCGSAARAQSDEFVLVDDDLLTQRVRVAEVNRRVLSCLDHSGAVHSMALDDCIALIRPEEDEGSRPRRYLLLADGQRLPGSVAGAGSPGGNTLTWVHPWLGRIDVSIDDIKSIVLRPDRLAPRPSREDLIVLANGDRLEGIITALTDPITIETDAGGAVQTIEVPLDRIAAVTLMNPPRPSAGQRVFFDDGTVLDVSELIVGADGYVRFAAPSLAPNAPGAPGAQIMLHQIRAIVLDPRRVVSLGRLTPAQIGSPEPRYVVPEPEAIDPDAPLGPGGVEYRGPLVARYELPAGCRRFAAEAILPRSARAWGDFELIVRNGDEEFYRRRLNAEHPTDTINVPIAGRELIIELTQGGNGPIQDRLILRRPLLLVE